MRLGRSRRAVAIGASLVLLIATVVLTLATDGVFPGGAVVLAELVAAALLPPLDTALIAIAATGAGVFLAHDPGGFSGWSLVYRSIWYAAAAALAFVLSLVRSNREREVRHYAQLDALHEFTTRLFAATDIAHVGRVIAADTPRLLGAAAARLLLVDGDRLLPLEAVGDGPSFAGAIAISSSNSAIATVTRRNAPMYFSNIADYERDYPGWSAPVVNMGGNAVAVVPAERDGSVLGVLVVFYAEPRLFTGADRVAIAQVAHEIAIVVESARLRERDRAAAAKLQESLLGPPLMVPDVGHEVRYVAAEAELHVGGDWYNAQRLPDGRTCFAVGDVVGRGLDAAMVMGQLRSALSAFADRSETPADAIASLDRFSRRLPGAASTSVAVAFVDIARETIEYTLAGHPPPVYVSPTGTVELLDAAIGRPLGLLGRPPGTRPTASRPFPPGSLMLLYSDGLIERRRESLDTSLDRLCAAVQRRWSLPLSLLSDALVDELLSGRRRDDDAALLVLRSPGANDHLLLVKEDATPDGLRATRTELRGWLMDLGIDGDDSTPILVAVGEAMSNAVEHAYDDQGGLVRVEATVLDDEIVSCVHDNGRWRDNAARAARGNGLAIMREFMDDVQITRGATGTTVTLRYALTRARLTRAEA